MLLTRELRTTAIRYAQFVLEKLGEAIVSTLLLVLINKANVFVNGGKEFRQCSLRLLL